MRALRKIYEFNLCAPSQRRTLHIVKVIPEASRTGGAVARNNQAKCAKGGWEGIEGNLRQACGQACRCHCENDLSPARALRNGYQMIDLVCLMRIPGID